MSNEHFPLVVCGDKLLCNFKYIDC